MGQLKTELLSKRIIAAYIVAITGTLMIISRFGQYAASNHIQFLEPFVLTLSNRASVSFLIIGYLLLMSDAPFVNSRTLSIIYRTRKKIWAKSMFIYIILHTLIYYLIVFIAAAASCMYKAYPGNIWSTPMYVLTVYNPTTAFNDFGISSPGITLIKYCQPLGAALHSFLLIFLYSILLTMIMFVINMNIHKIAGSLCTVFIHVIGYAISGGLFELNIKYSLLANAILPYHNSGETMSLSFSYSLFTILIIICLCIMNFVTRFSDYKASISGIVQ